MNEIKKKDKWVSDPVLCFWSGPTEKEQRDYLENRKAEIDREKNLPKNDLPF